MYKGLDRLVYADGVLATQSIEARARQEGRIQACTIELSTGSGRFGVPPWGAQQWWHPISLELRLN